MTTVDITTTLNKTFREHRRYTGDGLPNQPSGAPLPVGDPSSGVHNPAKSDIRGAFTDVQTVLQTAVNAAELAADEAQDAQAETESFSDAAISLISGLVNDIVSASNVPIFSSRNGVALLTIPAGLSAIRTNGFSIAGDGGGALYKRVVSEPAHNLKVQSADGAWWEIAESTLYFRMGGAKGDGITDDTAAINNILDFARQYGREVRLGFGIFYITDTLDISNSSADPEFGNRISLSGEGYGLSQILANVSGSTPALSMSLDYIANGQARSFLRDFSVYHKLQNKTGYGLALTGVSYLDIERVDFEGFNRGIKAVDAICVNLRKCKFVRNNFGIDAARGSFSNPNAWTIDDCIMNGNYEFAALLAKPANLNVRGGTFEGNGVGGVGVLRGGIYINGHPSEGDQGLNVSGGYYEGNSGAADILIDCNDSDHGSHVIIGATFNRISGTNFVTHNIAMSKAGLGRAMITVLGCGFRRFNTYPVDAGRKYIDMIGSPVNNAYNWNAPGHANHYFDSLEIPTLPGPAGSGRGVGAAWVRFNGSSMTVTASHNVDSVVRNGAGDYTINFKKALRSSSNCIAGSTNDPGLVFLLDEDTTFARVKTVNLSGVGVDYSAISVVIMNEDS